MIDSLKVNDGSERKRERRKIIIVAASSFPRSETDRKSLYGHENSARNDYERICFQKTLLLNDQISHLIFLELSPINVWQMQQLILSEKNIYRSLQHRLRWKHVYETDMVIRYAFLLDKAVW